MTDNFFPGVIVGAIAGILAITLLLENTENKYFTQGIIKCIDQPEYCQKYKERLELERSLEKQIETKTIELEKLRSK